MPFGSELMIEIIQTQWFPHSNRMKSDCETTLRILKSKSIPQPVIFLTLTAVRLKNFWQFLNIICFEQIEHALKEWSHGIRPIQLIPFSDEGARKRYVYISHNDILRFTWECAALIPFKVTGKMLKHVQRNGQPGGLDAYFKSLRKSALFVT